MHDATTSTASPFKFLACADGLELVADDAEQHAMRSHLLCLRDVTDGTRYYPYREMRAEEMAGKAGGLRNVVEALCAHAAKLAASH